MMLENYVFYLFALVTIVSAFIVVFSKNIVHSAVALFFTLFSVSGFYVLLRADFIALTQILVYIGGILVLIIFGIMLTNKVTGAELKTRNLHFIPSVVVTGIITGMIIFLLLSTDWNPVKDPFSPNSTIKQIGFKLLGDYLLPFEIASVILLVALIGSAMYARKK
ncbi:MAG: NADH-quinone oxidoreductase subunit J [Ignavibacteria bacterium]|nr:NADH-quinone oxidoreductase subunit J [Ignavibacteria bacterium]